MPFGVANKLEGVLDESVVINAHELKDVDDTLTQN